MSWLPYLLLAFVTLGIGRAAFELWRAARTGEMSESVWYGASNQDDHYGFILRVGGLILIIGILVFLVAVELPNIFALYGEGE